MRTFIAVPLPQECHKMLEEIQAKLRSTGAGVGWVNVPSIHLTLKFLGEVDPETIPRLASALRTASEGQAGFTLRLHGVGGFPDLRSPRVIWCGVEGETQHLRRLQERVEDACIQLSFPSEGRDFHPHLTLGRVQGKRNLQSLLDYIKIGFELECSFRVDRYNLYRSTLAPRGAVYDVLEVIALRV